MALMLLSSFALRSSVCFIQANFLWMTSDRTSATPGQNGSAASALCGLNTHPGAGSTEAISEHTQIDHKWGRCMFMQWWFKVVKMNRMGNDVMMHVMACILQRHDTQLPARGALALEETSVVSRRCVWGKCTPTHVDTHRSATNWQLESFFCAHFVITH